MSDESFRLKIKPSTWAILQSLAKLKGVGPDALINEYIEEGLTRDLGLDSDFITQALETEKQRQLAAADAVRKRRETGDL